MRLSTRITINALSSFAAAALITASSPDGSRAAGFELLSRSLLEKSPRDAVFFEGCTVLASGGSVALYSPFEPGSGLELVPMDGEPYDLEAGGPAVYAAVWGSGLAVIDLAAGPPLSAPARAGGGPGAVMLCLYDGGLLLGDIRRGGEAFDLSDPLAPASLGTIGPSSRPVAMAGCGRSAAVAWGDSIYIFTAGPGGGIPRETAKIKPGRGIAALRGTRDILIAIYRDGSTEWYDMSEPAAPAGRGTLPAGGKVADAAAAGGEAYLLLDNGEIRTVPLAGDGAAAGRRLEADYTSAGEVPGVKFSLGEKVSGAITGSRSSSRFPGKRIAAGPELLVTFDPGSGFWIFGPAGGDCDQVELGFREYIDARGFAIDLFAAGGYLYLANGDDGLRTGKVLPGGSIEWTDRDECEVARDVAVDGRLLALADGSAGLKTFDLSDPADPAFLGEIDSPFYHSAVVLEGGIAFVAGGLGGAELIDLSDPRRPRLDWREKFSEVRGVFAEGDVFYIPDGFEGVRIYRNDGGPSLLSTIDTPGWACDVYSDGSLLYVADGGEGIVVMDVSDPLKPRIRGSVGIGSIAREIHLRGKTLFVASHKKGITAVDVSDPDAPFIAARFQTVDDARGVYADEALVYLASGAGGVYIFRYSK